MIVIFEMDTRGYNGVRFNWRPGRFRGRWKNKRTWRVWWGFWSVSFYPSPGLHDFFKHVEDGNTQWYET
jgi:hypothetical protein